MHSFFEAKSASCHLRKTSKSTMLLLPLCETLSVLGACDNNSIAMAYSLDFVSSPKCPPTLSPLLASRSCILHHCYLIVHSQKMDQLITCPFFSRMMPLASTLLTRRLFGTWVHWWTIIQTSSMCLMSSTLSLKQYQYPFLLLEGPKSSYISSFAKSWPTFKHLRHDLVMHKS